MMYTLLLPLARMMRTGLRILSEGMMHKHEPPHIVGLTAIPVNSYSVFLNTQLGTVWWHEATNELISLTPFTVIGLPDDNDDVGGIKGKAQGGWASVLFGG